MAADLVLMGASFMVASAGCALLCCSCCALKGVDCAVTGAGCAACSAGCIGVGTAGIVCCGGISTTGALLCAENCLLLNPKQDTPMHPPTIRHSVSVQRQGCWRNLSLVVSRLLQGKTKQRDDVSTRAGQQGRANVAAIPPCNCFKCLFTSRSNSLALNFLAVCFSSSKSVLSLHSTVCFSTLSGKSYMTVGRHGKITVCEHECRKVKVSCLHSSHVFHRCADLGSCAGLPLRYSSSGLKFFQVTNRR